MPASGAPTSGAQLGVERREQRGGLGWVGERVHRERVAEAEAAALAVWTAAGVQEDVARPQVVDPGVDDGARGVQVCGSRRQAAPRRRWAKRLRNLATLGATTAAQ